MRKRHNLEPRMEKCADLLIPEPEKLRGRWLESFPGCRQLYLELGCGKGRFTADTAALLPDTLIVAIEKVPDAMILAMERIRDRGLPNVRFIDGDAARLLEMFAPGEVQRLYINFCDPWPKSRDAKFRLTAPGFLRLYADLLSPEGQIHFKTDNGPLFDWSVEQLTGEGWALSELTHDLHEHGPVGVMTDYEAKFTAEGLKINRLVASNTPETKGTAAGPVPRLRSAALADARGAAPDRAAPLCLEAMSLPLCLDFFRQLEQAPELFEDPAELAPYSYDPAAAEAWFKARAGETDRRDFAILLDKQVIGALAFKHLDPAAHSAELEICLVNDRVKNRDHGTRAVALALEQGFGALGLESVTAAVLSRNTRSRRVLQKNGFFLCGSEGAWQHYRLTREQYTRRKGEERT